MISRLRDNPILWHFAPWKSRGVRGRLFWLFLTSALVLPVLASWLLGSGSPIPVFDTNYMMSKAQNGLYNRVMPYTDFPVVASWVWFAALIGVSLVAWLLAIAAVYLQRLNLVRMGLLEQVFLTGLDRNRAAVGTVAWGAMTGLLILSTAFIFQIAYTGYLYPVAMGYLTNLQSINGVFSSQPRLESIPFGVGYAFVLFAGSLAVWSQAVRGALRQTSEPWFRAPTCFAAGAYVLSLILLGVAVLGSLPGRAHWNGIYFGNFSPVLIILSSSVIVVMMLVQMRTISRSAGRICFGPVNMELFQQTDWWESELAHRGEQVIDPPTEPLDWIGRFMLNLSGVSLALFILSIMAMNTDLRAMTVDYPYVVALLGIYAPAGVAVFEWLRGPLTNHLPVRGRLIRSAIHGSMPMLVAVAIGLVFFLWIAAGLNNSIRSDMDDFIPWITVGFGMGFGLLAHVLLLPRRGRKRLLVGFGAAAVVLLITPLVIGGIALFCLGLGILCSLPTGLMSVLFQRIHDDLPADDSSATEIRLEAEEQEADAPVEVHFAASEPVSTE